MNPLRGRDFALIFGSYGLSSLGDYLALTTLTLRVEELTGSGWAVSALLLAGLLPIVLFATLAGLIVDRVDPRRVLAAAAALQAAVAAGLAHVDSLPAILALSFLLGAGVAVAQPALLVLVPHAAGEARTTQANALLEVARWGGTPLGAVLGGTLTAALGHRPALLADAGTFLLVALAALALRVRRPSAEPPPGEPVRREARRGIVFMWEDRILRLVVLVLGAAVVFAAIDNVAEVFFARDVLRAGRAGFGWLVGMWTLGIALGALITGRLVRESRLAMWVLLSCVAGGEAVAIAAGFPTLAMALAMWLIGGVANGVAIVAMRSLIHHRVPEPLRGRAFAAYSGLINAAQIGALALGGALFELVGARASILIAGVGAMATGVVGTLRYSQLPDEAPAGFGFLPAMEPVPGRPRA